MPNKRTKYSKNKRNKNRYSRSKKKYRRKSKKGGSNQLSLKFPKLEELRWSPSNNDFTTLTKLYPKNQGVDDAVTSWGLIKLKKGPVNTKLILSDKHSSVSTPTEGNGCEYGILNTEDNKCYYQSEGKECIKNTKLYDINLNKIPDNDAKLVEKAYYKTSSNNQCVGKLVCGEKRADGSINEFDIKYMNVHGGLRAGECLPKP